MTWCVCVSLGTHVKAVYWNVMVKRQQSKRIYISRTLVTFYFEKHYRWMKAGFDSWMKAGWECIGEVTGGIKKYTKGKKKYCSRRTLGYVFT
jgi:hypothetical protein